MLDCLILGGGVIGLSTARELARCGLQVAVVDAGRDTGQASWAAGGILSSMRPWAEAAESRHWSDAGKRLYPTFAAELREETGIDPEYWPCGLLILDAEDAASSREWATQGGALRCLSGERSGLPTDVPLPEHAVLLPEIAQIRPPRLLAALRASLRRHGLKTIPATVHRLRITAGRCTGVDSDQGELQAETYVLCTGAWSSKLLENLAPAIRIQPVRGQMLCLQLPTLPCERILLEKEHYLIPRRDGHVLIGSTMEQAGFDPSTTREAHETLLAWGNAHCPALGQARLVRHWAGLRPGSDHGKPWCGPVPGIRNLHVNCGHFRKGILQAPACAQYIAEQLCTTH